MIPKIIHYCWLGPNEKSDLIKKCMESWEILDDYEIKFWNEENMPKDRFPVLEWMCKNKLYAHASDLIRVWAVCTYGGIWLDTDVMVYKRLDDLLNDDYFFAGGPKWVNASVFGCVAHHEIMEKLLNHYRVKTLPRLREYPPVERMFAEVLGNDVRYLNEHYFMRLPGMMFSREMQKRRYTIHMCARSWREDYLAYKKRV